MKLGNIRKKNLVEAERGDWSFVQNYQSKTMRSKIE